MQDINLISIEKKIGEAVYHGKGFLVSTLSSENYYILLHLEEITIAFGK